MFENIYTTNHDTHDDNIRCTFENVCLDLKIKHFSNMK